MFLKFSVINFKKHFLYYCLIIALETALLCVSLAASGIVMNAVFDDDDGTGLWAKYYMFRFPEEAEYSEMCDTINEFSKALPNSFKEIMVWMNGEQRRKYFYDSVPLFLYPDYETMCRVMKERWGLEKNNLPTEAQFSGGEKAALVGNNAGTRYENGEEINNEYIFTDERHILIDNEEFLVTGRYNGWGVYVFFNSAPEDTILRGIELELKTIPSTSEMREVEALVSEYFGEASFQKTPEIETLLDKRKNAANVLLSVSALAMSAFNTLLVFRYIVSSRKKYFAILRLAGFSKKTSVLYCGGELLMINAASVLLSRLIFGKAVMPFMGNIYMSFSDTVFSAGYYAAFYGVFSAVCAVMFAVYIVPSLTSSVAAELRGT